MVLSLFPGIGLLDMAFEEEGFSVVRGPDLLWGGDIRRFHVPAGVFAGVIGGPPCKAFSRLVHMIRANGYEVAANLIPEFERVVREAKPDWFVMENVPAAPRPAVLGYYVHAQMLADTWVGGATSRQRRISFGARTVMRLGVMQLALHTQEPAQAVVGDARAVPVKMVRGGAKKNAGVPRRSIGDMLEAQGFPRDMLDECPLTESGKREIIGNGVPLPMGRAIAKAVKRAMYPELLEQPA